MGLPAAAGAATGSGFLEPHPRWRFVFVNHATTNPFFVPTRYGIQDACRHYGASYAWTGSRRSDVGEMVRAMRRAIDRGADGIAVSVIDRRAFNKPTVEALSRGIPVVSYNADGGVGNTRLAYIGQDLYQSGLKFGARIAELVKDGDVFLFIATPGQLNIQPRIDGALDAIKDSGKPIRATVVATGTGVAEERKRIEATYASHKKLRGMFAVDGGSTQGVAEVMRRHGLRQPRRPRRRLRPAPGDAPCDRRWPPRFHDRPAAVPAGVSADLPALHGPLQQRSRRALGHEHRPALRHARQRTAVSDDDHALRGQLPGVRISRHVTQGDAPYGPLN